MQSTAYVTQKAQVRDVALSDGSRVAIGADSALAVNYTAASRNLQLKNGEAFFEVEHNPDRPFVVQAGRLKVIRCTLCLFSLFMRPIYLKQP